MANTPTTTATTSAITTIATDYYCYYYYYQYHYYYYLVVLTEGFGGRPRQKLITRMTTTSMDPGIVRVSKGICHENM